MKSTLIIALSAVAAAAPRADPRVYVEASKTSDIRYEGKRWEATAQFLEMSGKGNALFANDQILEGDFVLRLRLSMQDVNSTETSILLGDSTLTLDGQGKQISVTGVIGQGKRLVLGDATRTFKAARVFDLEVRRSEEKLQISVDGKAVGGTIAYANEIGGFGVAPANNRIRLYHFSAEGAVGKRAPATAADVAKMQPQIDRAIDRGVQWLLAEQLRDGSWGTRQGMFLGGQTALCAYTLLKCGVTADHPSLERAFAFLDQLEPAETYTISLMLLAYEATHNAAYQPRIKKLVDALLKIPTEGLFSYPNKWGPDDTFLNEREVPDLSNQQFAVLGLNAAHKAGVDVPAETWQNMLTGVRLYQEREKLVDAPADATRTGTGTGKISVAGFGYRSRNNPYGSMTAAGVCGVKICMNMLEKKLNATEMKELDSAALRGLAWLGQNLTFERNPGTDDPAHLYYYYYAVERVGAFMNVEYIGGRHWYYEGARKIVSKQEDAGSWYCYYKEADTCFALLFLRRASAPILTGNEPTGVKGLFTCETPQSAVHFRAQGTRDLNLWLTGFSDETRKAWSGAKQEGLRVALVEYLVDGQPVARLEGDAAHAWKDQRYATRYSFSNAGTYAVSARVQLVNPDAPPDDKNGVVTVNSERVSIQVDAVLEPWMIDAATSRSRNLLVGHPVSVTSSSDANTGETAKRAVDGRESTRWVSAPNDKTPTLHIEIGTPVKANALVLTSGAVSPRVYGLYDKARKVAIFVNGDKKPLVTAEIDPDDRKPNTILFPKPMNVAKLEIRILERAQGGQWKGHVGFAEVSLELRKS